MENPLDTARHPWLFESVSHLELKGLNMTTEKAWCCCVLIACFTAAWIWNKSCETELETTRLMVEAGYKRTVYTLGTVEWTPTR